MVVLYRITSGMPASRSASIPTAIAMRVTRSSDESAPDIVKKYVNYGASVRAAQFLVLAVEMVPLGAGEQREIAPHP